MFILNTFHQCVDFSIFIWKIGGIVLATKRTYQTRIKIIDAYINLMQTRDFDTITVKAITEKAGITRGTFYLYFADIYELITYIENTLLNEMPNTITPRECIVEPFSFPSYEVCQDNDWERKWFTYYDQHHTYFNALLGPHGDTSFKIKIKKSLQNTLRIKMNLYGMPDDIFQQYFMEIIPNMFLLLAGEWTKNATSAPLDIDAVIEIISTIRIGSIYRSVLNAQRTIQSQTKKE